MKTKLLSFRNF